MLFLGSISIAWSTLITNRKYTLILIFSIACLIRIIPELSAYPYPIGYDVINSYIPIVTNFKAHLETRWPTISGQFPLYFLILHLINIVTGLDSHSTVTIFAIVMFGIFAISIFLVGCRLLKISTSHSIFLTFFVILQMAVLRTTWDHHRDIFALSMMFFTFLLIYKGKKEENASNDWQHHHITLSIAALILSALTASADRMIGALLSLTLLIYVFIAKSKITILCALVAVSFFAATTILPNHDTSSQANIGSIITGSSTEPAAPTFYNPTNLLILFAVINGLLIPTGIIGLKVLKKNNNNDNSLLKIPLLITFAASLLGIVFPDIRSLVADRWIILCGIFLSIFSAYGIIHLVQRLNLNSIHKVTTTTIFSCIIGIFIIIGMAYATMPKDNPFILYGIVYHNIENFAPVTMQLNSIDPRDNAKMISAIAWINNNTEPNAIIVSQKHWRGWMEIELEDDRRWMDFGFEDDYDAFDSSRNLHSLIKKVASKNDNAYLVTGHTYILQERGNNPLHMIYFNGKFAIFKIKSH